VSDADHGREHDPGDADPHLTRIAVHPVKSLDPEERETAEIGERGGLVGDREFAIVDAPADAPHDPVAASPSGSGDYVNGKKTARRARLRSGSTATKTPGPSRWRSAGR